MRRPYRIRIALLGLLGLLAGAAAQATPPQLTAGQLQQDVRVLRDFVSSTHPQPEAWVSAVALQQAWQGVEARLQAPATTDEAWRVLAALNPVFADAHLAILQPQWRTQAQDFLRSGGMFFPFEVQADASGELFVRAELGGTGSALARRRIERINGLPAKQVVDDLLGLMHGDTASFRAELLSRRFWFFYWKTYGAPARFDLVVDGQRVQRAASTAQGEALQLGSSTFERTYHVELLGKDTALLTLNAFSWPDKEAFYAFTTSVFTRLRDEKVRTLLIDVRENGGGDDDMWMEGVLRHIADKPFRHASTYVKKVIAGRAGVGEKVGDIVHGSVDNWVQPQAENPIRFGGQVYVLVGGGTYSSAVLFANVVQDFGFGQLVGAPGLVRARQSGGVQARILPNTGLEVVSPRFILDRPSGRREPPLLQPDIVLPDDPFDRKGLVDALLARQRASAEGKPR